MNAQLKPDPDETEKWLSPEAVEHFKQKYREPPARELSEREFYRDQYSCPERLFR